MNETQLLIGSLSNDLLRIANLIYRGSYRGADRFYIEAKRWASQLKHKNVKPYIRRIVEEIDLHNHELTMAKAEMFLMYSILLQNYVLHGDFK